MHPKPRSFLINTAVLAMTAFSGLVLATSPAAWSDHDKEVAATCVRASNLKNARPAGLPMVYDDRVGMTVLLLMGRYPQPHMKNQTGRELCLFDRKTREAAVTEADQLGIRAAAPTVNKK